MSVDKYLPSSNFFLVHSSWMWVMSASSTIPCTMLGGMKYTPSRSPNTTSPGITIDARHHQVVDRRRHRAAVVACKVDRHDALQGADRLIYHEPGPGGPPDVIRHV